jgi:hypothetical protein
MTHDLTLAAAVADGLVRVVSTESLRCVRN